MPAGNKSGGGSSNMPTSTAAQARLTFFQPTRRPVPIERLMQTPWGKVRLKARLGQQHADVLEAICFSHERKKVLPDESIKLLVDPAKVRRLSRQSGAAGHDKTGKSTTLQRVLDDLQQALVEIIEPARLACQGQIVGFVEKAVREDGTPITATNPLTRGERSMWSVTLGPVLSRLVQADIWLGYNPAPIARLRHGISQAVARHVLSHKTAPETGWHLDGLIKAVASELDDQQLRDRRRELRADAEQLEQTLGIALQGDRIFGVGRVEQSRGGGG